LILLLNFPSEAPYRIDQVTMNPALMLGLAIGQLLLAAALYRWNQRRPWWWLGVALIGVSAVFFALANWGTSDITRFSHYLAIDPSEVLDEPLWIAAAPLISALPYRLASLHGLVAGGFALVPLLLARVLQRPQWGGIWALLVLWSPLLRNFLQNGVTRQALATVLITPLLMRVAGWWHISWAWVAAAIAGSALSHNSLPITTSLALVPALTRPELLKYTSWRTITLASCLLLLSVGIAFSQPAVLDKVSNYLFEAQYFNTYGLRKAVYGVELAALIAVLLTIWRTRRSLTAMARDHDARTLFAYSLLLGTVQLSMATGVLAPILSRCLDPIGLFWLLSLMVWTARQGCAWTLIPAFLVVGESFIDDRILVLEDCINGDQFLCIPDRWPWQVRW
jgi:hypothetical protein